MIKIFLMFPMLAITFAAGTPAVEAAPKKSVAPQPLSDSQITEIRRRMALLKPGEKKPLRILNIERYRNGVVNGGGPSSHYSYTQNLGSNGSLTLTYDYMQKPPRFLKAELRKNHS